MNKSLKEGDIDHWLADIDQNLGDIDQNLGDIDQNLVDNDQKVVDIDQKVVDIDQNLVDIDRRMALEEEEVLELRVRYKLCNHHDFSQDHSNQNPEFRHLLDDDHTHHHSHHNRRHDDGDDVVLGRDRKDLDGANEVYLFPHVSHEQNELEESDDDYLTWFH